MKRMILLVLAAGQTACSPLSALVGPPGGQGQDEAFRALGEHISQCDRHYQGGLGVGGSLTFNIDCKAQPPSN